MKVVLFQLRGHGHPQDDASTNFFPDSKSSILGLLNEVSFVSDFWGKVEKVCNGHCGGQNIWPTL